MWIVKARISFLTTSYEIDRESMFPSNDALHRELKRIGTSSREKKGTGKMSKNQGEVEHLKD